MRNPSKTAKRFIASAVFLAITVALMMIFKHFPDKCFPWYRSLSKWIMGIIASITRIVPIAIWDFAEVILIIAMIISFIKMIIEHKSFLNWLSKIVHIASILFFVVVSIWMLNHYAPPLAQEINLNKRLYSQSELLEAAEYYTIKAAEFAKVMERDEEGNLSGQDFYELAEIAGKSYGTLENDYPVFRGVNYPAKKLWLFGDYLLYKGFTGEFMPYTAEASVPANDAVIDLPFVMCHECAHRLCIASEEEANFAAYLACESNDDPRFKYSAYYSAYVYCYNALSSKYRKQLRQLKETNDGCVLLFHDSDCAAKHYDKYDSKLSEAGENVNDMYLKSFSEESGVKSYGEVVDDLVAWYRLQKP